MVERLCGLAPLALRFGVSLALVKAIGAIAHLPLGDPPTGAALRIALRIHQARIEVCRDNSPEELARLPVHMRQARVCRETPIDYRLRVAVDGEPVVDRMIRHRGVRRNRPLTVDERVAVSPGLREVTIDLTPQLPTETVDISELPVLQFAEEIQFERGRIRIVTLEDGRLVCWPPLSEARNGAPARATPDWAGSNPRVSAARGYPT